jgi:hypothetical protein
MIFFFFFNKIALKHKSTNTTLQGGKKTEGGSEPLHAEREERGENKGI